MNAAPTGTVTFLFTDIEGSTTRWERDRAAMAAALARHDAILRSAIATHDGTVFKTVGDAFCAAFPSASDALAAAIAAQHALAAEDWSAFGTEFGHLRVRIGIHTGLVEVAGSDYFGPPLNRVARLTSAGHGGQILLSLATQQLVRDDLPPGVTLRDLGLHRLKDLRYSEHIFQVLAPGLPDVATPPDTAEKLPERGGPLADVDLLPAECPYRGLHAFREADARLVTTGRDEAGHETAEVVREALIRSWGRLREWMNADRRFRAWQERLRFGMRQWEAAGRDDAARLRFGMRQWEAAGRDDGALLRGVPLAEAEQWVGERSEEMTEGEREFVAAGSALRARREAEREAQRERELEAARQLAETQRLRAEEQATNAGKLRKRALVLVAVAIVAVWMDRTRRSSASPSARMARAWPPRSGMIR